MTVGEAKKYIIEELDFFSDSATFEAGEILSCATGIKPSQLLFSQKEKISRMQFFRIKKLIAKRKKGVPLQYLLGEWEFYSVLLKVGKGVLIPRQDTELLVDTALEYLSSQRNSKTVFDFCSGSGAVGIAIALNSPKDRVILVEKSHRAFRFLNYNNKINGKKCETVRADVTRFECDKKCDLLVCNPPYIPSKDIKDLSKEVKNEPKMALDGGKDGLDFYRKIVARTKDFINPGGRLMFEIGFDEAESVKKIMETAGLYDVEVLKDLCGNDRVVFGDIK